MPKTKISEFSATPANNTDIDSINIAEGCAPSGINDAIRELMAQLKDWQSGTSNDPYVVGSSGSLTLNQGTANGVAYLNGSKVVTSGSALTFDGSNLGVTASSSGGFVGLTTQNTSAGAGASSGLGINNDSTASTYLRTYGSGQTNSLFGSVIANYTAILSDGVASNGILFGSLTNKPIIFGINNTEGMRLTSTGLGIGTSSPAAKLHIKGSSNPAIYWENSTFGSATNAAFMGSAGQLIFGRTGVADWLTIDNSGNLGLGVTPSAWNSGWVASQIGSAGSIAAIRSTTGPSVVFQNNAFLTTGGAWNYITSSPTNPATQYEQYNGNHIWYRAAAGTGAITWTQAMTLTSAGDLVVGATSANLSSGSRGVIEVNGASTAYIGLDTGGTLRGTFYSNGSIVGLATATLPLTFGTTGGTEWGRFDTSGNLLLGVTTNPNTARSYFRYDGMTTQIIVNSATTTAASTNWSHYVGQSGDGSSITTNNIFIFGNGNIQNANNSYGALSDAKLKENIVDATPKLDKLMQVRIRNYNLKGDYEQHKQLGVVAQELETVFPSMVEETSDKDMEGNDLGTTTKSVKYSVFVPMLIKAIQEQQAIIESLKARLDAANL